MKGVLALLVCLIAVTSLSAEFDAPNSDTLSSTDVQGVPACDDARNYRRGTYPCLAILQFDSTTAKGKREQIAKDAKVKIRFHITKVAQASAVIIPDDEAMFAVSNDPVVKAVIPDRAIFASANSKNQKPVATAQVVPAGIKRIGAAPGSLFFTGKGIGVAITDTGIDLLNKDLNVATQCFSAFSDCQDRDGHGTHVAGIVAARNNTIEVVGVAPDATLYAVKVLDDNGNGSDATLLAGLEWIANNAKLVSPAIRVVNMSLGRAGTLDDNTILRDAIRAIKELGISVVVAAGNDQNKEVAAMVPATYPEVIAVASSTAVDGSNQCRVFASNVVADAASYFTTDGAFNDSSKIGVTISAPGEEREDISRTCALGSVGILSLKVGGGTVRMSGTSMAAPHVTGVVALLLQKASVLDAEQVRSILRSSAFRIGTAPLDTPVTSYSFDGAREGVVSACQALGVPCI